MLEKAADKLDWCHVRGLREESQDIYVPLYCIAMSASIDRDQYMYKKDAV